MKELRKDLLSELQTWLISKETHPDIILFLCDGLHFWFQSSSYEIDHNVDATINLAFSTQILLGWESLLRSFCSYRLLDASNNITHP